MTLIFKRPTEQFTDLFQFDFFSDGDSCFPGAPMGGADEPGLLVQEETDERGQTDQAMGTWRSAGGLVIRNASVIWIIIIATCSTSEQYDIALCKKCLISKQVRRAIYEEQHNIAPGRKHNYSSNYNTGYDNQVSLMMMFNFICISNISK